MNLPTFRSKPFIGILFCVVLFGLLFGYISFQNDSQLQLAFSEPQTVVVKIEPAGPVYLHINETKVFIANISQPVTPLTYYWASENSSTNNFAMNETDYLLLTCKDQAVFKLLTDRFDFIWLSVMVNSSTCSDKATVTIQFLNEQIVKTTSDRGTNSQSNQQNQIQNQNFYTTNEYNYLASTASYLVETDGNGLFQVINGTNGNIVPEYTSNYANTSLNAAISKGGIVTIKSGDYSGALLNVPGNASIIGEPGVKGIKYISIDRGARIDEPNFNAAFRGYASGTFTLSANCSASATVDNFYVAFDHNNIFYSSNNSTDVLNYIVQYGGKILVLDGIYPLTQPIVLKSNTHVIGESQKAIFEVFSPSYGFILNDNRTWIGLHDSSIEGISIDNDQNFHNKIQGLVNVVNGGQNVKLEDLWLDCGLTADQAAYYGINVVSTCNGMIIQNPFIQHYNHFGIYLDKADDVIINSPYIISGFSGGVGVEMDGFGDVLNNAVIVGGKGVTSVRILGSNCIVNYLHVEVQPNLFQHSTITIGQGGEQAARNNFINYVYSTTPDINYWHIITANAQNTVISNCWLTNGTIGIYIDKTAVDTKLSENVFVGIPTPICNG